MAKQIVIAVGGNALGSTHTEQLKGAAETAAFVCDLLQEGCNVVITHGNGPQLGQIDSIINKIAAVNPKAAEIPFSARIAMTQAYIGGDIANALREEMARREIKNRDVVSIITEVLVDENDPAFAKQTKPIGKFMTKAHAEELAHKTGITVMEDAGRGYRKVTASPKPQKIIRLDTICRALDEGNVVITCGGAGIPVIKEKDSYRSVYAVIDKDYVSALMAREISADSLVILTGMEKVSINYRKPNETGLNAVTADEAQSYINAGQFAAGSMLPKMDAAAEFARSAKGRKTIITDITHAMDAFKGKTGTRIMQGTLSKGRYCLK